MQYIPTAIGMLICVTIIGGPLYVAYIGFKRGAKREHP